MRESIWPWISDNIPMGLSPLGLSNQSGLVRESTNNSGKVTSRREQPSVLEDIRTTVPPRPSLSNGQCVENDVQLNFSATVSTVVFPYVPPEDHLYPLRVKSGLPWEENLRQPHPNLFHLRNETHHSGVITSIAADVTIGHWISLAGDVSWPSVAAFFIMGFLVETFIFLRIIKSKHAKKMVQLRGQISEILQAKENLLRSTEEITKQTENLEVVLQLVSNTDTNSAIFKEQIEEFKRNLYLWESDFLCRLKALENTVDIIAEFSRDEEIRELFQVQGVMMQAAEKIPPLSAALEGQILEKRNNVISESQQVSKLSELFERAMDIKKVSASSHRRNGPRNMSA